MEDIDVKINNFHKNIDDWLDATKINYGMQDLSEECHRVGVIMHFTEDDIKKLSFIDCQAASFTLNKYVAYLNTVLSREKAVKQWAEQGIWYIVTGQKHNQYAKWEEKYHASIRNSKTGIKLQMLKTTAEFRILSVEAQIKGLEHAMKVLESIARSKSYERS